MAASADLTNKTIDLLQHLIRNECVNEGTEESGQEVRNADLLQSYIEGAGLDVQRYDAAPGRTSIVARIEGSNPNAPSLCLNGHTDVVPVNPDGWDRDPFGGELVDGEVWGRGCDRHARPHRIDGGHVPPSGRHRLSSQGRPDLLRCCRRRVGKQVRRPMDGRQPS